MNGLNEATFAKLLTELKETAAVQGNVLTTEQVEEQFVGKGYGDFKTACGEAVVEMLRPFREQVEDLMKNKDYLDQVAREGADMAARLAYRTLSKVQKKVGFVPKP